MKAMIGPMKSLDVNVPVPGVYEPSMEFEVLLMEDTGQFIARCSINVAFTTSTNQNQLLPLAKEQVILCAQREYGRTIGVNDIKSAVLQ